VLAQLHELAMCVVAQLQVYTSLVLREVSIVLNGLPLFMGDNDACIQSRINFVTTISSDICMYLASNDDLQNWAVNTC
jgi:hypothetical protein